MTKMAEPSSFSLNVEKPTSKNCEGVIKTLIPAGPARLVRSPPMK